LWFGPLSEHTSCFPDNQNVAATIAFKNCGNYTQSTFHIAWYESNGYMQLSLFDYAPMHNNKWVRDIYHNAWRLSQMCFHEYAKPQCGNSQTSWVYYTHTLYCTETRTAPLHNMI
jgi:hypothetical protein